MPLPFGGRHAECKISGRFGKVDHFAKAGKVFHNTIVIVSPLVIGWFSCPQEHFKVYYEAVIYLAKVYVADMALFFQKLHQVSFGGVIVFDGAMGETDTQLFIMVFNEA